MVIEVADAIAVVVLVAILILMQFYRKEIWMAWDCADCGERFMVKPTWYSRRPRSELADLTKQKYRNNDGDLICHKCRS